MIRRTKFLFPSLSLFFIIVTKSFSPLGSILLFALVIIFCIASIASFFSFHFPSLISFSNLGVICFEISTLCISSLFTFTLSSTHLIAFFGFIVFLSSTVTFSISPSITFNVDSFMSFNKGLISFPTYLYIIQIKEDEAVRACGFVLLAKFTAKEMSCFKSIVSVP